MHHARHVRCAPNVPAEGGSAGIGITSQFAWRLIAQSGSITMPITLSRAGGYTGDVALAATSLPSGVTASFSDTTLTGAEVESTLTLTASAGATVNANASFTITASGTGVTSAVLTIVLIVSDLDFADARATRNEPTVPTTALNGTYTTFGHVVTRLSDLTSGGVSQWYVDRSPLSRNGTWIITINSSGGWALRPITIGGSVGGETISSGAEVSLPIGGAGQPATASPGFWDTSDSDCYWMTSGYKLWKLVPSTMTWTMVRDFASEVAAKDMSGFTNIVAPWNGTAVLFMGSMAPTSTNVRRFFLHLNKESKNSFGTMVVDHDVVANTITIVRWDVGIDMGPNALPVETLPTSEFSATVSGTVMTVISLTDGSTDATQIKTGMTLAGAGLTSGSQIVPGGTGTGLTGTYFLNVASTIATATTITGTRIMRYNGGGMDRSGTYAMQQMAGTVGVPEGLGVRTYAQAINSSSVIIGATAATSRSSSHTVSAAHGVVQDSAIAMVGGNTGWYEAGVAWRETITRYDLTTAYTGSGFSKRVVFAWHQRSALDGFHIGGHTLGSDRTIFASLYQSASGARITDEELAHELFAIDTAQSCSQPGGVGTPVEGWNIIRLGHHFSWAYGNRYWQQPHAVPSMCGRFLIFASTMGDNVYYNIFAMRLPLALRSGI